MNLESLRQILLAAARANPPDDGVPYAFEKRILARLKESPAVKASALWARALWRAAAPCVAVTFLLGVWSFIGAGNSTGAEEGEFAQRFEQTLLAAVDETGEVW